MKPASCSSRQKSLRGFAKCAAAAAETRPGLIPQKMQVRPCARTSGTADSGVLAATRLTAWHDLRPRRRADPRARQRRRGPAWRSPVASAAAPAQVRHACVKPPRPPVRAGVEALLEQLPRGGSPALVERCVPRGREPHHAHALVAVPAVAPGVALGLAQRPQPHGPNPRTGVGRTEVALRDGDAGKGARVRRRGRPRRPNDDSRAARRSSTPRAGRRITCCWRRSCAARSTASPTTRDARATTSRRRAPRTGRSRSATPTGATRFVEIERRDRRAARRRAPTTRTT